MAMANWAAQTALAITIAAVPTVPRAAEITAFPLGTILPIPISGGDDLNLHNADYTELLSPDKILQILWTPDGEAIGSYANVVRSEAPLVDAPEPGGFPFFSEGLIALGLLLAGSRLVGSLEPIRRD